MPAVPRAISTSRRTGPTPEMSDTEARLAALETEVRALRDHIEIAQVIARYGPLADSADTLDGGMATGALWAEDGVYDLGGGWEGQGPAGIAGLLDNDVHRALVRDGAAHIPSAPRIVLDGDRATALNYTRVYKHENGAFSVWRVSVNRWELARGDAGWKIVRRTNRLLDGNDEARGLLRTARDN